MKIKAVIMVGLTPTGWTGNVDSHVYRHSETRHFYSWRSAHSFVWLWTTGGGP